MMNPHRHHVIMNLGEEDDGENLLYYQQRTRAYVDNIVADITVYEASPIAGPLLERAVKAISVVNELDDLWADVEENVMEGDVVALRKLVTGPRLVAKPTGRPAAELYRDLSNRILSLMNPNHNGGVSFPQVLLDMGEGPTNHYLAALYYINEAWIRTNLIQWHLADAILWDINPDLA